MRAITKNRPNLTKFGNVILIHIKFVYKEFN